ncbi:Trypsin-like peptidase domain-containing protein [Arthrobacter sp. yr096]|uniref:S1 family peptidase n=1 Tax=Arthrobacter sp. yr096 TaxID=1761750 RepID=UPI0008BD86DA|nr:serine protease [Arthrobacter sp. yr096]SEJ78435.1 Trypsin-like peptidase domain-containing protein [Arthrobacter sp. yr096]
MDYTNHVAPLAAPTLSGPESSVGSGFLVQIESQIYLVTVAHLATGGTSQTDDWTLWADEITLHNDEQAVLASSRLFDVESDGTKVPRFKYARSSDVPKQIADVILLPLESTDDMASMSQIFPLPAPALTAVGQPVVAVGRRPWPTLTTSDHEVVGLWNGMVRIKPPVQPGYSGGVLLTPSGALLGINYGTDNPMVPGEGLAMAAGLIVAMHNSSEGFVDTLDYTEEVKQEFSSRA